MYKQDAAEKILKTGPLYVAFYPKSPGVVVPTRLSDTNFCTLVFGLNLAIPVLDMRVAWDSIQGTLRFGEANAFCRVPWHSAFALFDALERGVTWAPVPESFGGLQRLPIRAAKRSKPVAIAEWQARKQFSLASE